jgi:hypothetical protein
MNGTALIKNWIVVDANTSSLFPDLVGNTPGNGTKPSGTPTASNPAQFTAGASSLMSTGRVMGFEIGVVGGAVLAAAVGCLVNVL